MFILSERFTISIMWKNDKKLSVPKRNLVSIRQRSSLFFLDIENSERKGLAKRIDKYWE
jgi:hypothetical protein